MSRPGSSAPPVPPGAAPLFQETYAEAEPQRVNRWLALKGVCSRREAEALILQGRVRIDGEAVRDVGRKISPGEALAVLAAPAGSTDAPFTAVLNKPVGYVSGQPEPGKTPAARLITRAALLGPGPPEPPRRGETLAPLGRLDEDSRGLLLLSTDGALARAVIGPESPIDKEYRVRVRGPLDRETLHRLRFGLELDGRPLRRARVDRLGQETLRFVLLEGRKRQIRRMCRLVGLEVIDLVRLRVGPLELGDLPEGRWRPLEPSERAALLAAARPQGAGGAGDGPGEAG